MLTVIKRALRRWLDTAPARPRWELEEKLMQVQALRAVESGESMETEYIRTGIVMGLQYALGYNFGEDGSIEER